MGKYHLALDTGMCRIGVDWQDAVEFRRAIDFPEGTAVNATALLDLVRAAVSVNQGSAGAKSRREVPKEPKLRHIRDS